MVNFWQILEYLSGSVQICTDSQGVLNMGNVDFDFTLPSNSVRHMDPIIYYITKQFNASSVTMLLENERDL